MRVVNYVGLAGRTTEVAPPDVVNFEVGAPAHLHWVDENGFVREPFERDCQMVYVDGLRCPACPPEPARTSAATVVAVNRDAGTLTVSS